MSFAQFADSSISSFGVHVKPFNGSRKFKQAHLMPTRSNTPEETSPTRVSEGSNDYDSSSDASTPLTRSYSRYSENSSDYGDSGSQFEIDVRPKRRKFNTVQERNQFVEDYKRKYKTEMCKNWELRGTCKFGDKCCFAHGRHELKGKALTHVKYKTKPCKQYHQSGYCPYGQRCQYLHKEALSPNIFFYPSEDKTKQTYYTYEMLHEINMICNTDADLSSLFETLPQRSRLSVFTKMAVNDE
jgi:hypothetical protein